MRNNLMNKVHVEGRVHDHALEIKTVQNQASENYGKEFIGGSIDIATDDAGLNIVTVQFPYVTPTYTKSGRPNSTYQALKAIIDRGQTILVDGLENATLVRIETALGLNDFYTYRNGGDQPELVSAKRIVGGFVNLINAADLAPEKQRNTFKVDILINGTQRVEADPERHIDSDYLLIKGAVFDFRKAILPMEFIVRDQKGMAYFEGLGATTSEPVFTNVWGNMNIQTFKTVKREESAFGDAYEVEYSNTIREWLVTGTLMPDAIYPVGDSEQGITSDDIKKAMADRNLYLAEVKQRAEEYQARRNAPNPNPTTISPDDFNF